MQHVKLRHLLSLVIVAAAAGMLYAQLFTAGSAVWAEWTPNNWYHGKVGAPCEAGYTINFDDGDVKCCARAVIATDTPPPAGLVKTGTRVVAEWTNGRYYPGRITSVDGETYHVNFDDGDQRDVGLHQIRIPGR